MNDTEKFLLRLIEVSGDDKIEVNGDCQHCGVKVILDVDLVGTASIEVNGNGGMKYFTLQERPVFICDDCHSKGRRIGTPCEVYSRCVGYLSPTKRWNRGKKEEFKLRTTYNTEVPLTIPTA